MRKRRRLRSSVVGNGGLAASAFILLRAGAVGDGLGDDADVTDAGLAKSIDNAGENAEGDFLVATEEDGVLRFFQLRFHFCAELMNVDGVVAEIDFLRFVDRDDQALLGDFLNGMRFGDVEFNAGLQDGSGDHEDDQENEHDVDERHHVDLGERSLRRFGERRHGVYRKSIVDSLKLKVRARAKATWAERSRQAEAQQCCAPTEYAFWLKSRSNGYSLAEGFFDFGRYFQCERVEALG